MKHLFFCYNFLICRVYSFSSASSLCCNDSFNFEKLWLFSTCVPMRIHLVKKGQQLCFSCPDRARFDGWVGFSLWTILPRGLQGHPLSGVMKYITTTCLG